jgi:hypothetical protein
MLTRGDVVEITYHDPIFEQDPSCNSDDDIQVNRGGQLAVVVEAEDECNEVNIYTLERYFPDNRGTVPNHLWFRPECLHKIGRVRSIENVYDVIYESDKLRIVIDAAS